MTANREGRTVSRERRRDHPSRRSDQSENQNRKNDAPQTLHDVGLYAACRRWQARASELLLFKSNAGPLNARRS